MGISSSSSSSPHPATRRLSGGSMNFIPVSAKVVGPDGRLEEFRRRTTASEVVSGHPGCYLCSSDTMVVDSTAPQLPGDHVLQFGQIYFLLPLSKSLTPLSLHDLCDLAIKASAAIVSSGGDVVAFGGAGGVRARGSGSRAERQKSGRDLVSCRKLSKKMRNLSNHF